MMAGGRLPTRSRGPLIPPAWRTIPVLAAALLPLRLFFGVTFLYAGLDKVLDPTFFDATSPGSLHGQLTDFARLSPLGDLIRAALPIATPIGVLIAIAEIGVGMGLLAGIAYRIAAAGGAALSLLFWLTASWATQPYYYGADLPYMVGFLTLASAGHGGLLVSRRFLAGPVGPAAAPADVVPSPERRVVVQTGLLAALSVIVASFALPLRAAGIRLGGTGTGVRGPSASPGVGSTPGPTPLSSIPAGSVPIATVADVRRVGSATFTVPFSAKAPLPAGDPGVIVLLPDNTFVAYDAVCTHAGCTVEWDAVDNVLFCPCHGAAFDAAHDGAVLAPPAPTPLAKLPIVIDPATGTILLAG